MFEKLLSFVQKKKKKTLSPSTKIVFSGCFRVEFFESTPLNFAKWKVSYKTKNFHFKAVIALFEYF